MSEVIIPPMPGVFSALGLLVADVRHDLVTALGGVHATVADADRLERAFADMERAAREVLAAQGFAPDRMRLERSADLKVAGQTYELTVAMPEQGPVTRAGIDALVAAFGRLYRERYAFFFEGEPIELVNARLAAFGISETIELETFASGGTDPTAALIGTRSIYFDKRGFVATAVYDRTRLRPGMRLTGPAIIEEPTSVSLLPPGFEAEVAADLGVFVKL